MNQNTDQRYPYTYAADLIRLVVSPRSLSCAISRSDASQIRTLFSSVLNISDTELAKKLADYFLLHRTEIENGHLERLKPFLKEMQDAKI